ncbi:MAG: DUF47 family protein [Dialister sp.]|uniref:DUF47 domain-containing protein n=1 Tax=Dialister sp. TaxID=1955814 RepID=UPI002E777A0E|nr:DUF47 family protein [Dialister sp.]MEE0291908.1 DUF47 family protein [Dialister sp.]
MSKEDKFFETLRDFGGYVGRVGFLLEEAAEGRMDISESFKEISDVKRKCRDSFGPLTERMYKAYKDPAQLDSVRGLVERMYRMVDMTKSVLGQLDMTVAGEAPEEFSLMVRLVSASLLEMKKILDYTDRISENYMKMEARCRRIYTYEDRGDDCYRKVMRNLYGEETKAAELVYWKEIFDHLEEVLDAAAGAVPLLQKMITKY